jgi:hypothetical protein
MDDKLEAFLGPADFPRFSDALPSDAKNLDRPGFFCNISFYKFRSNRSFPLALKT